MTAYMGSGGMPPLVLKLDVKWTRAINPLTPNDPYRGRTALLTSKRCILYIYSTNIGTEYFKHGIYSPIPPAWGLGEVLTTPPCKTLLLRNTHMRDVPRNMVYPALLPRMRW